MSSRQCRQCHLIKPLDAFYADPRFKDGVSRRCAACRKQVKDDCYKRWYSRPANAERCRQRARTLGKTERIKTRRWLRYHSDEEYRLKRREQCRQSKQTSHSRENVRNWQRAKRATDPQFRLRSNMSRRIRSALVGANKSAATMVLIGCTIDELRAHIELLWLPDMSWENYTVHGWHIDHITPCAAFDLTKPEEQRRCFHYSNLRPLWAIDNWRKCDYVPNYEI